MKTQHTPNGFTNPRRGWNSFGLQANPAINPSFIYDQEHVIQQADAFPANIPGLMLNANDYYISLDSGWSIGDHGDEFGRIEYELSIFNIPDLASYLHSNGLKLGVYVLPGAFCKDSNKTILGTDIPINATLSGNNNGFARCDFDFEEEGVQEWHDSVVAIGMALIKLDHVTPGSPSNGCNLPPDNSGPVIAYHMAIAASGCPMCPDISWKLERNSTYFPIWANNADSMRTYQDINNSQTIDNYSDFISRIVAASDEPVSTIYPDMDNLFRGNNETITGISDTMRETMTTHWIGAATNLISGFDMTKLGTLGIRLLSDPGATSVAQFTAKFPMQPRNPGTGQNDSKQLQTWIAGPDNNGAAVVVLTNYGPDRGQGGFNTNLPGVQSVSATWEDLGINGTYAVRNVWAGADLGNFDNAVSANLNAGESQLLRLTTKPSTPGRKKSNTNIYNEGVALRGDMQN
ncbi:glycoside hydrolase family 27 protein [Zopfia rhizophila CBS 207.26]|uniref:alpha-galactosidase n=1 Tax=Zopfia rhizophila CBS 207.26 TaxID=1314779 RepID=A0A6A6DTS6_9PEZI|nr:glycoside hydrolase family 27 protein [Zopfia rhizophila CBS 207.26]